VLSKTKFASILVIVFSLLLASPAAAVVQTPLYCIKSYKCYNGTNEGYIMSYIWDNSDPRQSMRVALSVDRPAYEIGDSVAARIRTDGYFTRDSGWWYIVKGANTNVSLYYPNGTRAINLTGKKTSSVGVYKNESIIFLDSSFPFGRYKLNSSIRGPSSGAPGQEVDLSGLNINGPNVTIYFDVGGEMNITLSSFPEVNKNENININGTVYQPNGQIFNSTFVVGVPGFSSYNVNISVMLPNSSIVRFNYTTTNGSYYLIYNATKLGTYYVISHVEYALGNQALRGRYTTGRVAQKFVVYGTWPEVGLGFAQSPLSLLALILALYLRRQGHG